MEREELLAAILDKEWRMLYELEGVKENEQQEKAMFTMGRTATIAMWSDELAESYLKDLCAAEEKGANMMQERFVRMVKNTAPTEYDRFKDTLPEVDEEKEKLVSDIWQKIHIEMTEFEKKYPALSLGGRPMTADKEEDVPSVETYQCSELLTYSCGTLRLLRTHIEALEAQGLSYTMGMQENTVKMMGFESLEDAEEKITMAAMSELNQGGCCCCGDN